MVANFKKTKTGWNTVPLEKILKKTTLKFGDTPGKAGDARGQIRRGAGEIAGQVGAVRFSCYCTQIVEPMRSQTPIPGTMV